VERQDLSVGIGDFAIHMSLDAKLTEARPNVKTNTIEIFFFILLPFQKNVNIFKPHHVCCPVHSDSSA